MSRDGIYRRRGRSGIYISYLNEYGIRVQEKIEAPTLTQARLIRNAKLAEVEKRKAPDYVPESEETFSGFVEKYLLHQKQNISAASYRRAKDIVEQRLVPVFGDMKLSRIRKGDVLSFLTARGAEISKSTLLKEFHTLKHFFNVAIDHDVLHANPCDRIKPPKAAPGRVRFLQPGELRATMEACPSWLRPLVGLLVSTGMRRGEALSLRWLDVGESQIILPQTKNGDSRVVHLNATARMALGSIDRGKPTDRVFHGPQFTPENVSLAFLRACRKAEIADFRLHDLRHTCASWLRMSGADLQDVSKILGHKDLRMTNRYAHLSSEHLIAAVSRLDEVFAPALTPDTKTGHELVTMEPVNAYKLTQTAAS